MDAGDVYRLGRSLTGIAMEAMREQGDDKASPVDVEVFADVAGHPDACVADIVARTGISQSAVSKAVARIREEGYFTVRRDPTDGRRVRISLAEGTPDDVAGRSRRPVEGALAAVGLDEAGIRTALRLLGDLQGCLHGHKEGRSGLSAGASERDARPSR